MTNIKLGKQIMPERIALKEKNDCTVRALSDSLEISYLEAYGYLIGAGRKRGRGIHSQSLYSSLALTRLDKPNMTVGNFVRFIIGPLGGNWIIQVRGHVFAVVEGEIKDMGNVAANLGRHVVQAWRMK